MKEEFITLETAKKIEQMKQNKKKHENQQTKINMSIIDANVKLQDENKLLKNDNEILQKRIYKAINILELSAMNKGICTMPETDTIQSALLILKGEEI